jgi:hypothetical protein
VTKTTAVKYDKSRRKLDEVLSATLGMRFLVSPDRNFIIGEVQTPFLCKNKSQDVRKKNYEQSGFSILRGR